MADSIVQRLISSARMQLAAEGFLVDPDDSFSRLSDSEVIKTRLVRGNTHASVFTNTDASRFLSEFEILAQFQNDPKTGNGTGFSGTLFKNRQTGELTLSFRSTEFIDDAVRDSKATNELEIKQTGWALGQIAEMEDWYKNTLAKDPNLLLGKRFNVTGYSLGGHLATAFNILRREESAAGLLVGGDPILSTISFNGAGTGGLKVGQRLTDVLTTFRSLRDGVSGHQWASPVLTQIYQRMAAGDAGGADLVRLTRLAAGVDEARNNPQLINDAFLLYQAYSRVNAIEKERVRLAESGFEASFAFGTRPPAGSQASISYQVATLVAARSTIPSSLFPFAGGVNTFPSTPVFVDEALLFQDFTEVVGSDAGNLGPSFVSNSGQHWGTRQEIYIEDQPLTRGTFVVRAYDMNLLVNNPAENDFADTHSLVLLIDSLSLMEVLALVDPSVGINTLRDIFKAAGNEVAKQLPPTQGKAEGNTLEPIANSLAALFGFGPTSGGWTTLHGSPEGNTWHLVDDSNGYTGREAFHRGLARLREAIKAYSPGTLAIRSLTGSTIGELIADAFDAGAKGVATRYALANLNPFAVVGVLPVYSDPAYALHGTGAAASGMTHDYVRDRAELLYWLNQANIGNTQAGPDGAIHFNTLAHGSQRYEFVDLPLSRRLTLQPEAIAPTSAVRLVFGGDKPEALAGGEYGDFVFAGAGADYLEGRAGNDYLEGGAGRDVYQYNAGRNLIGTESADGNDTIRDTDGRGVIRRTYSDGRLDAVLLGSGSSSTIVGGFFVKETGVANGWKSVDGTITLTRLAGQDGAGASDGSENLLLTFSAADGAARPGNITIKGWRQGDFGIRLSDAGLPPPPASARLAFGDRQFDDVNPATPEIDSLRDGLGNWLRTSVVQAGQDDVLFGGRPADGAPDNPAAPGDRIDSGSGNDSIYADRPGPQGDPLPDDGRGDADWLEAGGGRDWIEAGAGNDLVEGGDNGIAATLLGGDVVSAGAGDDVVFGDARVELTQAIADGDRPLFPDNPRPEIRATRLQGDFLAGGAGDDTLVGGAGDDAFTTGAGRDIVVAGAGDDTVANSDFVALGFNWQISGFFGSFVAGTVEGRDRLAIVQTGRQFINTEGVLEPQPQPQADAPGKTVYAGAGADWVGLGNGDDFIDAGSGNDIAGGGAGDDILLGQTGRDFLFGDAGNDALDGGDGDDSLFADTGEDVLFGGAGRDVLEASDGNDILIGGGGDDILAGGLGRDVYVFNRGDGVDTIVDPDDMKALSGGDGPGEAANKSDLVLGPGVSRTDIRFRRGSLMLDLGQGDGIHLQLPEGQDDPSLVQSFGRIMFADGSFMRFEDVLAQGFEIEGTERVPATLDADGNLLPGQSGDDVLVGTAKAGDRISGLSGDDVLSGLSGDDTLDGGRDNDRLFGGAGDDTYVFTPGHGGDSVDDADGVNTLSFGAGIGPDDLNVQVLRYFDYAQLRFVNSLRLGTIPSAGEPGTVDIIDGLAQGRTRYVFADGSVLAQEDILARITIPLALDGTAVADRLAGGSGGDRIVAGGGDDILVGAAGNDYLYGQDGNDTVTGDGGTDGIFGGGGDDVLAGGAGNDSIEGEAGTDELYGGAGADLLRGGAGDDRYRYEIGSGIDLIEDDEGANLLQFGAGIASAQVQAHLLNDADGTQYVQFDIGNGDSVLVRAGFGTSAGTSTLDFAFADGSRLDMRSLMATALAAPLDYAAGVAPIYLTGSRFGDRIAGSMGADRIDGADSDDRLYGDDGADRLLGGEGDDLLVGGGGDDVLEGGAGSDTYELRRGMGRDIVIDGAADINTISLDASLDLADLHVERSGNDLLLSVGGGEDSLTLRDQLATNANWRLVAASGAAVSLQDFLATAPPAAGATLADAMDGFARRLEESFGTMLALGGYVRQADGGYVRDVSDGSIYRTRHEVDRVRFASSRETVAQAVYVQATPVLQVTAEQSSQQVSQRTVTVSDTSGAAFVGMSGGGNVGGTPSPSGQIVADFPFVSRSGGSVSLSSGPAEPVFSTTVQARSGPPAPGQSIGGAQRAITGFFVYGGAGAPSGAGVVTGGGGGMAFQPRTVVQTVQTVHDEVAIDYAVNVVRIDGGAEDNVITVLGNAIVDAGDGDDIVRVVVAANLPAHAVVPPSGRAGALLHGGAGDDQLQGGPDNDVLVAGAGTDLLAGGAGDDRYLLIAGTGVATVNELAAEGIGYGNPADLARTLAGASSRDVVELPAGVGRADLRLTWSDEALRVYRHSNGRHGTVYMRDLPLSVLTAVLTISWGGAEGGAVRIVMPHSDDPGGSGVELLRLPDGSLLTRADLLAMAPHDLDPNRAGTVIHGNDIDAEAGDDVLSGAGILRGGEGRDRVTGAAGNDAITGDEGADVLVGGGGDDLIGFGVREFAAAGNEYRGGGGNDILLGTQAADVFVFERGDGADLIGDFWHHTRISPVGLGIIPDTEPQSSYPGFKWDSVYSDAYYAVGMAFPDHYAGYDTLRLGAGIRPDEVRFSRALAQFDRGLPGAQFDAAHVVEDAYGHDLVIRIGLDGDSLRIPEFFIHDDAAVNGYRNARFNPSAERNPLGRIEFADGTIWDRAALDARLDVFGNRAPAVVLVPPVARATVGQVFNFALPAGTIVDPNPGDRLAYSVFPVDVGNLDDEEEPVLPAALPAWLGFDANGASFNGTPQAGDVGQTRLLLRATDPEGLFAEATLVFEVATVPPPELPTGSGGGGTEATGGSGTAGAGSGGTAGSDGGSTGGNSGGVTNSGTGPAPPAVPHGDNAPAAEMGDGATSLNPQPVMMRAEGDASGPALDLPPYAGSVGGGAGLLAPGGFGSGGNGGLGGSVLARGTRTGLNLDAISAAIKAFEGRPAETPASENPSGSEPVETGPDLGAAGVPEGVIGRRALIDALARFHLSMQDAAGTAAVDVGPGGFSGLLAEGGSRLLGSGQGLEGGAVGGLPTFSGLAEGFARL